MSKSLYWLVPASFISISLLSGCAPTCVTIPSSSQNQTYKVGSGFSGDIGIYSPRTRDNNGLTQSSITFFNKTSDNESFQYKYTWLDKDGFNVGNDTPWQPVQLYPEMTRTVTSIAPINTATQYNVEVCRLK